MKIVNVFLVIYIYMYIYIYIYKYIYINIHTYTCIYIIHISYMYKMYAQWYFNIFFCYLGLIDFKLLTLLWQIKIKKMK